MPNKNMCSTIILRTYIKKQNWMFYLQVAQKCQINTRHRKVDITTITSVSSGKKLQGKTSRQ